MVAQVIDINCYAFDSQIGWICFGATEAYLEAITRTIEVYYK